MDTSSIHTNRLEWTQGPPADRWAWFDLDRDGRVEDASVLDGGDGYLFGRDTSRPRTRPAPEKTATRTPGTDRKHQVDTYL